MKKYKRVIFAISSFVTGSLAAENFLAHNFGMAVNGAFLCGYTLCRAIFMEVSYD